MLREKDGWVEGVDGGGDFFGDGTGAPFLPGAAQSASSTCDPECQIANSASRAAIYFWYDVLASWAFWSNPLSSSGESSALTRAVFLIDFARMPKRSVESVSDSLYDEGEQLIIRVVREFPPKDSCRIRVSLESRYGICFAYINLLAVHKDV